MVRPERFELPTLWFEAKCSIQLSYGRVVKVSNIVDSRITGKDYWQMGRYWAAAGAGSGSGSVNMGMASTMSSPARRRSW
jgi:hypothetical protein